MTRRFKIATVEFEADHEGPLRLINSAALAKYQFARVAGEKGHPAFWEGQWYCGNEDCTVREVQIHVKYEPRDKPRMQCPSCGKVMAFHHYLNDVPLLPVDEGPATPGEGD